MAPPPASPTSTLFAAPPGHLTLIMASRRTASFTLPSDPRHSFFLYVPRAHPVARRARGEDVGRDGSLLSTSPAPGLAGTSPVSPTTLFRPARGPGPNGFPLLVVMHDSSRDGEKLRDNWAELAEEEGCVVLSPNFPCDLKFPDGPDNYKRLAWTTASGEEVRYDQVLLDMINTIGAEWGSIDTRTFALVGFSGGGQFVHRFFYLYPERVHCVSIGAPGRATPLVQLPWPEGIVGAPTRADNGKPIDVAELAARSRDGRVKVHLLIGELDNWHPVQPDGTRTPKSRLDVTKDVARSFDDAGIVYDWDLVPGAKHEGERIRAVAMPWVRQHVRPVEK